MPQTSLLQPLLEKNQGIVFADNHDDPNIPHYLSKQMPALAESGVKFLFVEMFGDTPEQRKWLEAFNTQNTHSESHMQTWLRKKWHHPPRTENDYMTMLTAARDAGIKVIGIEPESRNPFSPVKSSNESWVKTIRSTLEQHPDAKFCILGGRFHTHEANQHSEGTGADQSTGVDVMLGIPCVTLSSLPSQSIKTEATIHPQDDEGRNYTVCIPSHSQTHQHHR